jgi:phosphate:Na+ symporter
MKEITAVIVAEALHLLDKDGLDRPRRERLWAAQTALQETSVFLSNIQMQSGVDRIYYRRLSLLHMGDHLSRLTEACLESENPIHGDEIEQATQGVTSELEETLDWLRREAGTGDDVVHHLAEMSARQADRRRKHRAELLEDTASNLVPPEEAQRRLESMRWVDRVAYHTWRALYHLISTPESSASETTIYPEAEQDQ